MSWQKIKYQLFLYVSATAFFFLSWNGTIPSFISDPLSRFHFSALTITLGFILCFFQEGYQPWRPFKNWLSLSVLLFYALYGVSVLFSDNTSGALKALEYKLSFLMVTYTYFSNPLFFRVNKAFLLKSFSLGVIVILFILDIHAFSIYLQLDRWPVYIEYTTALHPTYLGLCAFFLVVLCMKKLKDYSFKIHKKSVAIAIIAVMMIVHILIVQSRSTLLCLAFAFLVYVYHFFFQQRKVLYVLVAASLGLIVFFAKDYLLGGRLNEAVDTALESKVNSDESGTNFRLSIIKSYPEILDDIWLTGVGKGDAQAHLNAFYHEKGWLVAEKSSYNAHNQFVQVLIEFGVIGLLLFCIIFFLPYFLYHGFYFKIMLMGFTISMLFESLLERQAGIFLFIFIYCLFNSAVENVKNAKLAAR